MGLISIKVPGNNVGPWIGMMDAQANLTNAVLDACKKHDPKTGKLPYAADEPVTVTINAKLLHDVMEAACWKIRVVREHQMAEKEKADRKAARDAKHAAKLGGANA